MTDNKKTTIKDVAREAGVSVATVSYIMNNKEGEKILPETKKRVLQIANLLNYRPSHTAKSLATGKFNVIGICYRLGKSSVGRTSEILPFVQQLVRRINKHKMDVVFLPVSQDDGTINVIQNLDAIFAIDLADAEFKKLADSYFVPVIAIDSRIDDNLFYQIYTDYNKLFNQISDVGVQYLVMDSFFNEAYQSYIEASFTGQVLHFNNLTPDKMNYYCDKKIVVLGETLAIHLLPYIKPENLTIITPTEGSAWLPEGVKLIKNDTSKKADLAVEVLFHAIAKEFDQDHLLPV